MKLWLVYLVIVFDQVAAVVPTQTWDEVLAEIRAESYDIGPKAGSFIDDTEVKTCKSAKAKEINVHGITKYQFLDRMRWRAANECCRLKGKVLMTEHSSDNLYTYSDYVNDDDPTTDMHEMDAAWTSASNIVNERLYEWQSGEDFEHGIWGPGEPNNKGPGGKPEGCGHLFSDLNGAVTMNDWYCFQHNNFICENEDTIDIAGADVQENELDFCRDLASDYKKYGVRYYHLSKTKVRWKLADRCCKLHGLMLLSMDDESIEEYEQLRVNIHNSPHLTWTSGNELEKPLEYKWQTGQNMMANMEFDPSKKFCFFENYPQDYHPNRHCIQIRYYNNFTLKKVKDEGLRMRNVQCGLLRDFICERPRKPSDPLPVPAVPYDKPELVIRGKTFSGSEKSILTPNTLQAQTCTDPNGLVELGKTAFTVQSVDYSIGQYPAGMNCAYNFRAGAGCTLELSCDEIDIRNACTEDNFAVTDGISHPNTKLCKNPKDNLGLTSNLISAGSTSLLISFTSSKSTTFDRLYNGFNCIVKCVEDKQIITTTTPKGIKNRVQTEQPEYIPPYLDVIALPDHGIPVEDELILPDPENQKCNAEYYRAHKIKRQKKYPSKVGYDKTCPSTSDKPCPPNKVPKKLAADLGFQNRKLLNAYVTRAIYKTCVPEHKPALGFKLYDLMVNIYMKICPHVPERFLDNSRFLFKVLHYVSSEGRTELISKENFDSVHSILHHCNQDVKVHEGFLDKCHERTLSFDEVTSYICTKPTHEFNIRRNDPLIDIFWKIFEAVHAKCFPYFKRKRRMFHQFSVTIMDLLSTAIKERWNKASGSHEFWQKILGPYYPIVLDNIEKCTQHTVVSSALPFRMDRVTLPQSVRMTGETGH